MKINSQSQSEIQQTFQKVCSRYENIEEEAITDFYVEVKLDSGQMTVLDDDDRLLEETTIGEWADHRDEEDDELNVQIARDIRKELEKLEKNSEIAKMKVMKPFSFVLVDSDKEVIEDLLIVDDENVMIGSDLMAGLDDELDDFIEKLLGEDE